jgi:hypothetical protein
MLHKLKMLLLYFIRISTQLGSPNEPDDGV